MRGRREALEIELSQVLREAAAIAERLRVYCCEHGLTLAAVISETGGRGEETDVASYLVGRKKDLSEGIAHLVDCLVQSCNKGDDDVRPS